MMFTHPMFYDFQPYEEEDSFYLPSEVSFSPSARERNAMLRLLAEQERAQTLQAERERYLRMMKERQEREKRIRKNEMMERVRRLQIEEEQHRRALQAAQSRRRNAQMQLEKMIWNDDVEPQVEAKVEPDPDVQLIRGPDGQLYVVNTQKKTPSPQRFKMTPKRDTSRSRPQWPRRTFEGQSYPALQKRPSSPKAEADFEDVLARIIDTLVSGPTNPRSQQIHPQFRKKEQRHEYVHNATAPMRKPTSPGETKSFNPFNVNFKHDAKKQDRADLERAMKWIHRGVEDQHASEFTSGRRERNQDLSDVQRDMKWIQRGIDDHTSFDVAPKTDEKKEESKDVRRAMKWIQSGVDDQDNFNFMQQRKPASTDEIHVNIPFPVAPQRLNETASPAESMEKSQRNKDNEGEEQHTEDVAKALQWIFGLANDVVKATESTQANAETKVESTEEKRDEEHAKRWLSGDLDPRLVFDQLAQGPSTPKTSNSQAQDNLAARRWVFGGADDGVFSDTQEMQRDEGNNREAAKSQAQQKRQSSRKVQIVVQQKDQVEDKESLSVPVKRSKRVTRSSKKERKSKRSNRIIVEDSSDSESEDDILHSVWRNRRPTVGESWMEPVWQLNA